MFTIPRCYYKLLFHGTQSSGLLSLGIFDASLRELIMVWSNIIGEACMVEGGGEGGEGGGAVIS